MEERNSRGWNFRLGGGVVPACTSPHQIKARCRVGGGFIPGWRSPREVAESAQHASLFSIATAPEKVSESVRIRSGSNEEGGKERELRYEVKFSISSTCQRMLQQAQILLSGRYPQGVSVERLFKALLDGFIERKCGSVRGVRREKKEVPPKMVTSRVAQRAAK